MNCQNAKSLFVAWQDQETREYLPVGKLVFSELSPAYCFYYLQGVQKALDRGFSLFSEFEDKNQMYYSNSLFSVFANRVMNKSRPDYKKYLHRLGLSANATDFEILARSGGRRSTDSIELYVEPYRDENDCFASHFLVHGVQYLPVESQRRTEKLLPDEELLLMWDLQNTADRTALALRTIDRYIVGYLPRYLLGDSWALLGECGWLSIRVSHVNQSPAPIQQRLLCELQACWPDNFEPCSDEQYRPIVTDGIVNRVNLG